MEHDICANAKEVNSKLVEILFVEVVYRFSGLFEKDLHILWERNVLLDDVE